MPWLFIQIADKPGWATLFRLLEPPSIPQAVESILVID